MQQKRECVDTKFLKNVLPRIFFSAKRVLCLLGDIFNKVNRGIVQKPDEAGK